MSKYKIRPSITKQCSHERGGCNGLGLSDSSWFENSSRVMNQLPCSGRNVDKCKRLNKACCVATWNLHISTVIPNSTGHKKVHDGIIKWKHFLRYYPFVGESTDHRWIPRPNANDVTRSSDLFMKCAWITVEQTVEMSVIWDVMVIIVASL